MGRIAQVQVLIHRSTMEPEISEFPANLQVRLTDAAALQTAFGGFNKLRKGVNMDPGNVDTNDRSLVI